MYGVVAQLDGVVLVDSVVAQVDGVVLVYNVVTQVHGVVLVLSGRGLCEPCGACV